VAALCAWQDVLILILSALATFVALGLGVASLRARNVLLVLCALCLTAAMWVTNRV
jgi:hypothetical protein